MCVTDVVSWIGIFINAQLFDFKNKTNYYSFKIFPSFLLVKSTGIIHHNQLLLSKFGNNFVILDQ